jgi:type IV pilus assembly protein PilZ
MAAARPSVLSLNITSKSALYAAYMPQIKGGGLFIPTNRPFKMSDEVFILLSLINDPAKLPISGKVVWISPAAAQGGRAQGVGIQFGEDESGQEAKRRIEGLLAGVLNSSRLTHTL